MKEVLNPVQLAVLYSNKDSHKKGTQQILQERLIEEGKTISQSTISYWVKQGYVPYRLAETVSKITGLSTSELTKNNPRRKEI